MKGRIQTYEIGGRSVGIYTPPQEWMRQVPLPCIYIAGEEQATESERQLLQIMQQLEPEIRRGTLPPFLAVSLSADVWDAAYSPWPAEVGQRIFGGQADAYFAFLQETVQPYLQEHYPISSAREHSFFIGYSLAGIAALYAYIAHPIFGGCASVSGSLWYPDWVSYLQAHHSQAPRGKVYISLGKAEVKTRSLLMQSNRPCSEQTAELFAQTLGEANVCFTWNNGNHFFEVPQRQARAICWLLQQDSQQSIS